MSKLLFSALRACLPYVIYAGVLIFFLVSTVYACIEPPPAVPANNAWLDLGQYQGPASADSNAVNSTDADYSSLVRVGDLVYLPPGGGHAATYRNNVSVFNPATYAWSSVDGYTPCTMVTSANVDTLQGRFLSDNKPVSTHTYDLTAAIGTKILIGAVTQGRGTGCNNLDPNPPAPYVISSAVFRTFDTVTSEWAYSSIPALDSYSAFETDPVSGKVLVASRTALKLYDPEAGTLTTIKTHNTTNMKWSANLVYASAADRFYWLGQAGTARKVYEIYLDRETPVLSTITELATALPDAAGVGWDYNPNDSMIYGGLKNGMLYRFDPASRTLATIDATAMQPCGAPMTLQGFAWSWAGNKFVGRVSRSACYRTVTYTP